MNFACWQRTFNLKSCVIVCAALAIGLLAAGSVRADFGGPGTIEEFKIKEGPKTSERVITLLPKYWSKGKPTHYRVCEDPEFKKGCNWKTYPMNGVVRFKLSEGSGIKKIYFQAKRFGKGASLVVSAEIEYVAAQ